MATEYSKQFGRVQASDLPMNERRPRKTQAKRNRFVRKTGINLRSLLKEALNGS